MATPALTCMYMHAVYKIDTYLVQIYQYIVTCIHGQFGHMYVLANGLGDSKLKLNWSKEVLS